MPGDPLELIAVEVRADTDRLATDMAGASRVVDQNVAKIVQSTAKAEAGFTKMGGSARLMASQFSQVGQQIAAGTNAIQALAIQLPDLAVTLGSTGAQAGKLAAFFGGPWGIALATAASLAASLGVKLLETEDSTKKAARANELWVDKLDRTRHSLDEVRAAVAAYNGEQTKAREITLQTAAAVAQAAAANLSEAISIRQKLAAQMEDALFLAQSLKFSGNEAAQSSAAQQIVDLQGKIRENNAAIANDMAQARASVISVADEIAKSQTTQEAKIKTGFEVLRNQARSSIRDVDALAKRLTELNRQETAALDAIQKAARERSKATQDAKEATVGFVSPVTGGRITGRVGEQRPGHTHAGIDIAVPVGTPVRADASGVIVEAGTLPGYGNVIFIDHGAGTISRLAHLSQINVAKGAFVNQGDIIGLSGGARGAAGAGNSQGPHVHYEVRRNGRAVDPRTGAFPIDQLGSAERAQDAAAAAAKHAAEQDAASRRQYDRTLAQLELDQQLVFLRAQGTEEAKKQADIMEATAQIEAGVPRLIGESTEAYQQRLDVLIKTATATIDFKYQQRGADKELDEFFRNLEREQEARKKAADELAQRQAQQIRTLAGLYEDAFRGGTKAIWGDFKKIGLTVIAEVLARFTIAKLTGGSFNLGGAISAALGVALPGFASGGSMTIGGRGGSDTNVLSLNGTPVAKVSRGEELTIGQNAMGPWRGGQTVVQQTFVLDARHGITTPELLEYVNATARQAGQAAYNGAVRDTPVIMAKRNRFG